MSLNKEEEAKFAKLRRDCRELGVPAPPEIHIGFKIIDKNGKLILDDKQRGHSWTRNWYNAYLSGMTGCTTTGATFGAGHISGRDTGGTVRGTTNSGAGCNGRDTYWNGDGYVYKAASGSTLNGIVIGTNGDAFSAEAHQLGTLIAHGEGSEQMFYFGQTLPISVYDNTVDNEKWTITHERKMNNNSGAEIIVREIGLIWGTVSSVYAARWINSVVRYLDERSILTPEKPVPNGAQIVVTYEFSMDFSAID